MRSTKAWSAEAEWTEPARAGDATVSTIVTATSTRRTCLMRAPRLIVPAVGSAESIDVVARQPRANLEAANVAAAASTPSGRGVPVWPRPDREAQHRPTVEDGAGEQHRAGGVGSLDQSRSRGRVAVAQRPGRAGSADGGRRSRTGRRRRPSPASNWVSATCSRIICLHRLDAVDAQVEPQLQRPEAAAQRHLPVAVVDHRAALGGRRPQVLGQDAQRAEQRRPVGGPEQVAVEVDRPSTCAGWCSSCRRGRDRR